MCPPNGGSLQIQWGGEGSLRPILILQEHLSLNLNFQRGGVSNKKNPLRGSLDKFMNNSTKKKITKNEIKNI